MATSSASNGSTSTCFACRDVALRVAEDDQAVRLAHAAQDARALRAGRCATCQRAVGRALTTPRWYSVRPARLRIGATLAARTTSSGAGVAPLIAQQRVADEGVEGHHHRDRVAGQAEQDARRGRRCSIRPIAIGRPGRIAMRQNSTSPSSAITALRVIGLADADAARRDHRVGASAAAAKRGVERGRLVADDAEVEHLDAEPLQHAPRSCSGCCRRPQPASSVSPSERSSLPVEKKATRRRRRSRHLGRAERARAGRDRPDADDAAGGERDLAAREVLAGEAPVVAGSHDAGRDVARRSPSTRTNSCGTTVSSPAGIDRAGHDANALARGDAPSNRAARRSRRRRP